MPAVNDLSTKECFKMPTAWKESGVPSGKYFVGANTAEARLRAKPGHRFDKSSFSSDEYRGLNRRQVWDRHVWVDQLTDNNNDARVYWYEE